MHPNGLLLENLHFVKGLDAVADAFASTVVSDVVNMKDYESVVFLYHHGVGATGTSTLTVLACDDVVPSTTSAIPFWYKAITSGDTEGTLTKATASGFVTTAGSSQLYALEVRASDLLASGYQYVYTKAVESVDSPVLGGIVIIQGKPRHPQSQLPSSIT
jgi:hypothetical protein